MRTLAKLLRILFVVLALTCGDDPGIFAQDLGPDDFPAIVDNSEHEAFQNRQNDNQQNNSKMIVLDFEEIADYTNPKNHYEKMGIGFSGGRILTQGQSLNYQQYPPYSGKKIMYDSQDNYGGVVMSLDLTKTGTVRKIGVYATARFNFVMAAFDASGKLIMSVSTGGSNYFPKGIPNRKLEVVSEIVPIQKVKFYSTDMGNYNLPGNTFTLDDLYLEVDNQLNCLNNVQLYLQGDSKWGNDPYGAIGWDSNTNQTENIRNWGCALTSAAMAFSYYGSKQNSETVTPQELNDWLRKNNGYSAGSILWSVAAQYARDIKGIKVWYNGSLIRNDMAVKSLICNGYPTIMNVSTTSVGSHFVLADGYQSNSFLLKDPANLSNNLNSYYKGEYVSSRHFSDQSVTSVLEIVVHSPIELLVIDPMGRRFGVDVSTGQVYRQIFASNYYVETMGTPDSNESVESKRFDSTLLIQGDYHILAQGTGEGSYSITLAAEKGKKHSRKDISGYIKPGQVVDIKFTYYADQESKKDVLANFRVEGDMTTKVYLPFINR